jgi:hypothetical protein
MAPAPLRNYLRTYRLRAGLSQDDVAYLAGRLCGTQVCRHEVGHRDPVLENIFAYEIIFGVSASKLFEGEYLRIHRKVITRARRLRESLRYRPPGGRMDQKSIHLARILGIRRPRQRRIHDVRQ